jgi:hypothetical protein
MAMFNGYVSLPQGKSSFNVKFHGFCVKTQLWTIWATEKLWKVIRNSGVLNLKFWPRSIRIWPYGIEVKQPWKLPRITWVPILQGCAKLILILIFSLQWLNLETVTCPRDQPEKQIGIWPRAIAASGRKLRSANKLKPPRCYRGPGLSIHPFARDHSRPSDRMWPGHERKASRAFHGAGAIEGFKQYRNIEHI